MTSPNSDLEDKRNNILDLLEAAQAGNISEYLNGVNEKISTARDKSKEFKEAIINDKKVCEYDYYAPIMAEFSKLYAGTEKYGILGPEEILPSLGFSGAELTEIRGIQGKSEQEREAIKNNMINKLGFDKNKINPDDIRGVATEVLSKIGNKLVSSNSLLKKTSSDIYFEEINDMTKTIDEFAYIYFSTKEITDERHIRFDRKYLYLEAYENNKKALINAYDTVTHNKVNINDMNSFTPVREYMEKNHPVLIEAMKNPIRLGAAHSRHGDIEKYTTKQIEDMALRNFITAIVGLVVKTDKIADGFEKYAATISGIMSQKDGVSLV